ncbi:hypothetical protein JIN85_10075 [Luteolibacter pohnpeiensis]|uniref:DUF2934 domain-containing protein n=1 Tax=Luteolibacter pohnpeiensis TaxID=454153 RepID=A0A934S6H7_9BACT|nr:hypothetical protein [Luteolibacter pohnpeiensis]MBK1882763.1 hypothetical protein [Luteolibacter pohnpeiensis]
MAAKKTAKKAAKKTAKKAASTTKAVKTAKKAAKKATAKAAPVKKPTPPSPDEIAKAAYLNYRRRVELGLPGDSDGDWLEAASQLSKES